MQIRTRENFGSRFWDETSGPDDLHLQMVLPVIETELNLPQAGWAQDLSTHQLGRPQAVDEVPKLPLRTQPHSSRIEPEAASIKYKT